MLNNSTREVLHGSPVSYSHFRARAKGCFPAEAKVLVRVLAILKSFVRNSLLGRILPPVFLATVFLPVFTSFCGAFLDLGASKSLLEMGFLLVVRSTSLVASSTCIFNSLAKNPIFSVNFCIFVICPGRIPAVSL